MQTSEQTTSIMSQIADLRSKKELVMKHPETIVNGSLGGFGSFSDGFDSRSTLSRSSPAFLSSSSPQSMSSTSANQSPKRKRSSQRNGRSHPDSPLPSPTRLSSIHVTSRGDKYDEEGEDDDKGDDDTEDEEDVRVPLSSSASIPGGGVTNTSITLETHGGSAELTKSSGAILQTFSSAPSFPFQTPSVTHWPHQVGNSNASSESIGSNQADIPPKREKRLATRLDILSASTATLSRRTTYTPPPASNVSPSGPNTPRKKASAQAATSSAPNTPPPRMNGTSPSQTANSMQREHSAASRRARFARGGEREEQLDSPATWSSYAPPNSPANSSMQQQVGSMVNSGIDSGRMDVDDGNDSQFVSLLPDANVSSAHRPSAETSSHAGYYHYHGQNHSGVEFQGSSQATAPSRPSPGASHPDNRRESSYAQFLPPLRLPATGVTRDMQRSLSASSSGSNSGSTSPFHSPRPVFNNTHVNEAFGPGYAYPVSMTGTGERTSFSAPSFDTSFDSAMLFTITDDTMDHSSSFLSFGNDRRDSLGLGGDAFAFSHQGDASWPYQSHINPQQQQPPAQQHSHQFMSFQTQHQQLNSSSSLPTSEASFLGHTHQQVHHHATNTHHRPFGQGRLSSSSYHENQIPTAPHHFQLPFPAAKPSPTQHRHNSSSNNASTFPGNLHH